MYEEQSVKIINESEGDFSPDLLIDYCSSDCLPYYSMYVLIMAMICIYIARFIYCIFKLCALQFLTQG